MIFVKREGKAWGISILTDENLWGRGTWFFLISLKKYCYYCSKDREGQYAFDNSRKWH